MTLRAFNSHCIAKFRFGAFGVGAMLAMMLMVAVHVTTGGNLLEGAARISTELSEKNILAFQHSRLVVTP